MIRFKTLDEVYLLPYPKLGAFRKRYKDNTKKSVIVGEVRKNGCHIPYQYQPRLDYLKAADKLILDESEGRVWRKIKDLLGPRKAVAMVGNPTQKKIGMRRE